MTYWLEFTIGAIVLGFLLILLNGCSTYRTSLPKSPLIDRGCQAGEYLAPDSKCYDTH